MIEMAFYPYVVTLQVTPVVAIAPLILIWVGFDNVDRALILIAWIVAFFPMLTNTVQACAPPGQAYELMTLARARVATPHLSGIAAALPSIPRGQKFPAGWPLSAQWWPNLWPGPEPAPDWPGALLRPATALR